MSIQEDYIERVYAGVLGKLIGVYLGRPFEGWTYERIMKELGPIEYYVHEKLGDPLVVTDDDVAGTFTFLRALEDHGLSPDLTSEDIGKTWLNYLVEKRSVLWWGGNGNSSEHTAWLNLKNGIPAPDSGSIAVNGLTVAEQIGAQIFIDGWALVAPGKPALAAKFAKKAGSVSHDGESIYAAMLWAAMEAEAFLEKDVDHLLNLGLSQIPLDCQIAKLIKDIRQWHKLFPDWQDCRQKIADNYGYDKYHGNCHVMPNHALMIMALLYAPHDFSKGQMIVNTAGWDTDCNAGNLGCLHGIMLGLDGLNQGPDWRGPLADRMLISSADGGNSINDAVKMAYYIANLGYALAGEALLELPKSGAQFHFSLPGSTQGFQIAEGTTQLTNVGVKGEHHNGVEMLSIDFDKLTMNSEVFCTTPTFMSHEVLKMRTYDLMATPLLYSGQRLSAQILLQSDTQGDVEVSLLIRCYGLNDKLVDHESEAVTFSAGQTASMDWTVPDCGSQPIAELGVVIRSKGSAQTGRVLIDRISWSGTPKLFLTRPEEPGDFWHRAWVNGVDVFTAQKFKQSFHISQERGEGIIIHGTRQWTDYEVSGDISLHLGKYAGLTARTQGLRRFYAARITRSGNFELVRTFDEKTTVLATSKFPVKLDKIFKLSLRVSGRHVHAQADDVNLAFTDQSPEAMLNGGIGLIVADGAASALFFNVSEAV
jgi:ADP-ribosylglycohydrolase